MDHFWIPKLELIQSFGCTIRNIGLLIQYTADVSKRLLIMHCKGPFSCMNHQKTQFMRQIVTLLDREESSHLFNLYTLLQDKKFSLTNVLSVEGDVPQHSDLTLDWVLHVSPIDKSCFEGPGSSTISSQRDLSWMTLRLHSTLQSNLILRTSCPTISLPCMLFLTSPPISRHILQQCVTMPLVFKLVHSKGGSNFGSNSNHGFNHAT